MQRRASACALSVVGMCDALLSVDDVGPYVLGACRP